MRRFFVTPPALAEDRFELVIADMKRQVVTLEVLRRAEVERKSFVNPYGREMSLRAVIRKAHDMSKEARRNLVVFCRQHGVVEGNSYLLDPFAAHRSESRTFGIFG